MKKKIVASELLIVLFGFVLGTILGDALFPALRLYRFLINDILIACCCYFIWNM